MKTKLSIIVIGHSMVKFQGKILNYKFFGSGFVKKLLAK